MANEDQKDFNRMLYLERGMPKIQVLTDEKAIKKFGGEKMFVAPPLAYDEIMKKIPAGKVITTGAIRGYLAKMHQADFTCPLTAGIFISMVAWASHQRSEAKTPYWRTLKANGELNPKYPGGVDYQKQQLEDEGHHILVKGRKNLKYYVAHYEDSMYEL